MDGEPGNIAHTRGQRQGKAYATRWPGHRPSALTVADGWLHSDGAGLTREDWPAYRDAFLAEVAHAEVAEVSAP